MSEPIITQRCGRCKRIKPLSEFHKAKKWKNGVDPVCKECRNEACRRYRRSERGRQRAAEYRKTPAYRIAMRITLARYKERHRQELRVRDQVYSASERGRAIRRSYRKTAKSKICQKYSKQKNREKVNARNRLRHAIRKGRILPVSNRVCVECGRPAEHYHHHLGYKGDQAFDVLPYCFHCHNHLHRN